MIKRFRFGLRAQLIIAMIACIVLTVAITSIASQYANEWVNGELEKGLSAAAIQANKDVQAYRIPNDLKAAKELLDKSRQLDKDLENVAAIIFGFVAVVSVIISSLIATFVATRIARPLDAVSGAAKQVADGDLSARAVVKQRTSGETARLVENFNAMATSLEAFQRQSVESSAAIAHELRTPLAILHGRLQGILDGIFPRQNDDINMLIAQVVSLTQIVNDLSIVSLSTAGQLNVIRESIDAATEIALVLKAVQPDLEAAGFYVGVDLQPCAFCADPNRIRQATLALVQNARIHAESGRAIHIETALDGNEAIISVSDRGPGLPPGHAERVFEPFWRSDTSRNRASGGTGLGLSVVASIVAAHKGSVRAFPRKGGGVTFEMRLPTSADVQI
jgi:two-component system, OmpR family, sensor histidine kinase AdeS